MKVPEYYIIQAEGNPDIQASAEVRLMPEGDLLVSLRDTGAHADDERAIVSISVAIDGTLLITVMDGGGAVLQTIEVER